MNSRFHGPLDSFSAFPFESYLGQLKKMLRGTRRPLSQLRKRLSEIQHHDTFSSPPSQTFCIQQSIKANSSCDSFVMVNNNQILQLKSKNSSSVSGVAYFNRPKGQFQNINFYDKPLDSSSLGIYMIDRQLVDKRRLITLPLSDYEQQDIVKYVTLKDYANKLFVFFPILHHHL